MGASTIQFKLAQAGCKTAADLQDWYKRQVEAARVEHGSDPYNGTISTTRGLVLNNSSFTNHDEALDYIFDRTDKRGPVMAVELVENGTHYWVVGGWAAE